MKTADPEITSVQVHEIERLQEQLDQYRMLFEKAADVIYSVDADFRIIYISLSVEKHLGYMPEELTGKPFTELGLLTGESLVRSIEDTKRIIKGEVLDAAEYELIAKDGTIRIAEIRSTPVYKNGRVVSIVSVARDITMQRNAENALAESEHRFRTMAESISDGLIIMEEGKTVYVNDRACQLCGYPREELITLWGPDLTAPQSQQDKERILQKVRGTGFYPDQVDVWITRKDGTHCCLNLRFSFAYSSEKKHTGYVLISDISEHRRADDEMKETKGFLDNIIDNSIDAIVIVNPEGFFTKVNKSFLAMSGYAAEEVIGKRMNEFSMVRGGEYEIISGGQIRADEEYMSYTMRMAETLRTERRVSNWDSYIVSKNGRVIPIDMNIAYLFNNQGAVTGAVGILRDCTERKKAETEITETRDFLNNIIDSSLDPIVIGDKRGNVTRVNRAFVQLVGFKQEELIGKHLAELVPPQSGLYESTDLTTVMIDDGFYDRAFEQMKTLIDKGNLSAWESYYIGKNGKIIPVEQTMFYLYDKKGDRTGVVTINRDISERKKAEHNLMETRNFLGDVIRTSADGILVSDTMGTIKLVNEAVERISGYAQEELVGKNIHDFMIFADVEMRADFTEKVSSRVKPVYFYEIQWRGKDGRVVDVGMSVSTLNDSVGTINGMVACIRDITDRKAAERKLYEYQDQLRCLASQLTLTEEQERRYLASEIHDRISQSLALAKIKLGTLGAARNAPERQKEISGIRGLLEQSIEDTRALIFDLSPPFLYEFGLEKALEWLLEDMEKQHGLKIRLVWNGHEGGYDDDVRILLYQSIRELLINVIKHAHAKTATVSLDRNGQMVHVCVEDDGNGFVVSPDGFHVSHKGGYGIFSIQQRFQHLGGSLTVESQQHRGTRIALELPLVPAAHSL
jgi:PAS domain S-box-containing protein